MWFLSAYTKGIFFFSSSVTVRLEAFAKNAVFVIAFLIRSTKENDAGVSIRRLLSILFTVRRSLTSFAMRLLYSFTPSKYECVFWSIVLSRSNISNCQRMEERGLRN